METTNAARLDSLRNRHTLYEVALISPAGASFLVAYAGKSGSKLRRAVYNRAERIATTMQHTNPMVERSSKDAMTLSDGWVVKFTGRTERSAICEGELPRIAAA